MASCVWVVVTESHSPCSHCVLATLSYSQFQNVLSNPVYILCTPFNICISLGHLQSPLMDSHPHHSRDLVNLAYYCVANKVLGKYIRCPRNICHMHE